VAATAIGDKDTEVITQSLPNCNVFMSRIRLSWNIVWEALQMCVVSFI